MADKVVSEFRHGPARSRRLESRGIQPLLHVWQSQFAGLLQKIVPLLACFSKGGAASGGLTASGPYADHFQLPLRSTRSDDRHVNMLRGARKFRLSATVVALSPQTTPPDVATVRAGPLAGHETMEEPTDSTGSAKLLRAAHIRSGKLAEVLRKAEATSRELEDMPLRSRLEIVTSMLARIDVLQADLRITFRMTGVVRYLTEDDNLDQLREDDTIFVDFPMPTQKSTISRVHSFTN